MEKGRTFETVVGLLVLVTAIMFSYYVYTKTSWHSMDSYVLSANFDKADGLSEGGDVKISGIKVGKIIDTSVDPVSFSAVVRFCVSKSIKLPVDTSANVASDGLFGGRYLSLVPGGNEELLKEGDTIESTIGPIDLESLIGKFLFQNKDSEEKAEKN